ncbi:ribbon-helix-helix protein, CopG family [Halobaculum roseum]|uniref:Ribbon-helix-helix protein, CopG family n=1 Tax=Halobaculum roseum TaxID=2175149 RepID=A0ABD5MK86_9EURY|nr:ribbon-helix-helix protein, CopG family [Halobaculum roseum]QZY03258.1 ribbon-helix-helix protein, CopG family [Halobaculum roseum]
MAVDLTERVQEIAKARDVSESEVLEQALERGVETLWQDLVLSRYLNDEIPREEAVELAGVDRVKRAEREAEAVEEDVRWGLNA